MVGGCDGFCTWANGMGDGIPCGYAVVADCGGDCKPTSGMGDGIPGGYATPICGDRLGIGPTMGAGTPSGYMVVLPGRDLRTGMPTIDTVMWAWRLGSITGENAASERFHLGEDEAEAWYSDARTPTGCTGEGVSTPRVPFVSAPGGAVVIAVDDSFSSLTLNAESSFRCKPCLSMRFISKSESCSLGAIVEGGIILGDGRASPPEIAGLTPWCSTFLKS